MSYTNLTTSEKGIVSYLLLGYSNDKIAKELNISSKGVKFHLTNIYKKYNVKSRLELVVLLNQKES